MLKGNVFEKKADVLDLTGKKIDTSRPIQGGKNIPETEEQILERLNRQNKETIERLKNKKLTDPEDLAQGGPAGLSYLLAEDTNERIPFDKGKKVDLSKRKFMKTAGAGIALLSSLPFVGKFFKAAKLAKPAAAATETIIKSNAVGMPPWFPKLVARVIKEGEDVTRKAGSEAMEHQTVHRAKLPESGTPIEVTHDLTTGDTIVDIGMGKHGWDAGRHGQPAQLVLKKGEWIEPDITKTGKVKGKGQKSKDEFYVDEAEFTGGHPENIKYEESIQFKYGDHGSDFGELEQFATKSPVTSGKSDGEVARALRREGWYGKEEKTRQLALDKKYGGLKSTYKKDPHVRGKQADKDAWAQGRAEAEAEAAADMADDFASGGIAKMLGE